MNNPSIRSKEEERDYNSLVVEISCLAPGYLDESRKKEIYNLVNAVHHLKNMPEYHCCEEGLECDCSSSSYHRETTRSCHGVWLCALNFPKGSDVCYECL